MIGETVVVIRRVEAGRDPANEPIYETTRTPVDDVLVAPGPRTDIRDGIRPDGVDIVYSLHFPKTFSEDLRGCFIEVRDESTPYRVRGSPRPYTPENTPTRWHLPVEVERSDG